MIKDLITFEQFQIGYDARVLTQPITGEIPIGARVGIIGSNGSGKTTFVKTILGLHEPLHGSFAWQNKPTFGYVPQENKLNHLFPITVIDLLKMGFHDKLPRFRTTCDDFAKRAAEAMTLMEIGGLGKRLVRDLSGGQRQRALIARALITHPNVLILDEPFNSLDYLFKQKLWNILSGLREKEGLSLLLIEHDLNRIINQVDWVVLLGPHRTLYGESKKVLDEASLSSTFQTPVHILRESHDQIQIHFL